MFWSEYPWSLVSYCTNRQPQPAYGPTFTIPESQPGALPSTTALETYLFISNLMVKSARNLSHIHAGYVIQRDLSGSTEDLPELFLIRPKAIDPGEKLKQYSLFARLLYDRGEAEAVESAPGIWPALYPCPGQYLSAPEGTDYCFIHSLPTVAND